jgi:NAD(P)-dependent dehydrogenase (short-subunit alcohol dehydrogenase family)
MSNPVVLISGASRGIGRATAVTLAKLNYRLALVARNEAELRETARLAGAADALCLPADIADAQQVKETVDRVLERFGRLDALVNIAGLAPVRAIAGMTVEEWREVIDTNLSAVFYLTKFAWPHLRREAGAARGVIVNISSLASRDPFNGFGAYGAAKAGLNVFGLVAAREGEADHISVHTIAPGAVETAMFRQLMTPEQYPKEKTLLPEDVAEVIARCVTGELRYVSGEVIYLHKTP